LRLAAALFRFDGFFVVLFPERARAAVLFARAAFRMAIQPPFLFYQRL
jgi:hypothetical protein